MRPADARATDRARMTTSPGRVVPRLRAWVDRFLPAEVLAQAPTTRRRARLCVLLPVFGTATLVIGTLLAIRQTDLKLMLAYTTVSSLGLLVMLTGFGSEHAIAAAVLYLVAHSLFKGGLFMVAGLIDQLSERGSAPVELR